MIGSVLLLQLAAATPPPPTYSSPALEAFIAAAALANRARRTICSGIVRASNQSYRCSSETR